MRGTVTVVVAAVLAVAAGAAAGDRDAVGTAFTYQGVLEVDGAPVNGTYDLRFTLWDAETDGNQQGAAVERTGVAVEDGLVTEVLDFGDVLGPEALWLEIAVRETGTADWTVLAPRQRLRPAPQAAEAEQLGGHEASFFLDTSGTAQTKEGALGVTVESGSALTAEIQGTYGTGLETSFASGAVTVDVGNVWEDCYLGTCGDFMRGIHVSLDPSALSTGNFLAVRRVACLKAVIPV